MHALFQGVAFSYVSISMWTRGRVALLYTIRDEKEFNLSLAMLFAPIFFQGITAPENLSEEYEKYHNKMSSRFGLF